MSFVAFLDIHAKKKKKKKNKNVCPLTQEMISAHIDVYE